MNGHDGQQLSALHCKRSGPVSAVRRGLCVVGRDRYGDAASSKSGARTWPITLFAVPLAALVALSCQKPQA